MKTLKELFASCVLIGKFEKSAFVCEGEPAIRYNRPFKCLLFYDNSGTYYFYSYLLHPSIEVYTSFNKACSVFCRFVSLIQCK